MQRALSFQVLRQTIRRLLQRLSLPTLFILGSCASTHSSHPDIFVCSISNADVGIVCANRLGERKNLKFSEIEGWAVMSPEDLESLLSQ